MTHIFIVKDLNLISPEVDSSSEFNPILTEIDLSLNICPGN